MSLIDVIRTYAEDFRRAVGGASDPVACPACDAPRPLGMVRPSVVISEDAKTLVALAVGTPEAPVKEYSDELYAGIVQLADKIVASYAQSPDSFAALMEVQSRLQLIDPVRGLDLAQHIYVELHRNYAPPSVQCEPLRRIAQIATSRLAQSDVGIAALDFLKQHQNDLPPMTRTLYDSAKPLVASGPLFQA